MKSFVSTHPEQSEATTTRKSAENHVAELMGSTRPTDQWGFDLDPSSAVAASGLDLNNSPLSIRLHDCSSVRNKASNGPLSPGPRPPQQTARNYVHIVSPQCPYTPTREFIHSHSPSPLPLHPHTAQSPSLSPLSTRRTTIIPAHLSTSPRQQRFASGSSVRADPVTSWVGSEASPSWSPSRLAVHASPPTDAAHMRARNRARAALAATLHSTGVSTTVPAASVAVAVAAAAAAARQRPRDVFHSILAADAEAAPGVAHAHAATASPTRAPRAASPRPASPTTAAMRSGSPPADLADAAGALRNRGWPVDGRIRPRQPSPRGAASPPACRADGAAAAGATAADAPASKVAAKAAPLESTTYRPRRPGHVGSSSKTVEDTMVPSSGLPQRTRVIPRFGAAHSCYRGGARRPAGGNGGGRSALAGVPQRGATADTAAASDAATGANDGEEDDDDVMFRMRLIAAFDSATPVDLVDAAARGIQAPTHPEAAAGFYGASAGTALSYTLGTAAEGRCVRGGEAVHDALRRADGVLCALRGHLTAGTAGGARGSAGSPRRGTVDAAGAPRYTYDIHADIRPKHTAYAASPSGDREVSRSAVVGGSPSAYTIAQIAAGTIAASCGAAAGEGVQHHANRQVERIVAAGSGPISVEVSVAAVPLVVW